MPVFLVNNILHHVAQHRASSFFLKVIIHQDSFNHFFFVLIKVVLK